MLSPCVRMYVFVYFFQFRFLFVFIQTWMFFIHPSAPPAAAAALEDSTTAPPVLTAAGFVFLPERVGRRSFDRSVF
jgi:hypothetical protein